MKSKAIKEPLKYYTESFLFTFLDSTGWNRSDTQTLLHCESSYQVSAFPAVIKKVYILEAHFLLIPFSLTLKNKKVGTELISYFSDTSGTASASS